MNIHICTASKCCYGKKYLLAWIVIATCQYFKACNVHLWRAWVATVVPHSRRQTLWLPFSHLCSILGEHFKDFLLECNRCIFEDEATDFDKFFDHRTDIAFSWCKFTLSLVLIVSLSLLPDGNVFFVNSLAHNLSSFVTYSYQSNEGILCFSLKKNENKKHFEILARSFSSSDSSQGFFFFLLWTHISSSTTRKVIGMLLTVH